MHAQLIGLFFSQHMVNKSLQESDNRAQRGRDSVTLGAQATGRLCFFT